MSYYPYIQSFLGILYIDNYRQSGYTQTVGCSLYIRAIIFVSDFDIAIFTHNLHPEDVMPKEYIAHKNADGGTQSVKEHSENTAALASGYAIDPFKDICYNIGLYHDIGKYQPDFQKKITENAPMRVEHSICGAKELVAMNKKSPLNYMMAFCIAGHHGGLPDGGSGGG